MVLKLSLLILIGLQSTKSYSMNENRIWKLVNRTLASTDKRDNELNNAIKHQEELESRRMSSERLYSDKEVKDDFKVDIRAREGFKPEAYKPKRKDKEEKYFTIGYGHYGPDVKKGDIIDETRAEELLEEDVEVRYREIQKAIPDFNKYPLQARSALFSSWYRGSLKPKHKTVKLLNQRKFKEASKEFLNHDDYRKAKSGKSGLGGIIDRMETTSNEIEMMGELWKKSGRHVPDKLPKATPKLDINEENQFLQSIRNRIKNES